MDPIEWVGTGGGPLIVVPVEIADRWRGDEAIWPPTGYLDTLWEAVRRNSDYGRACGIQGSLGVLEVGPGTCLVLHGDALPTTLLPTSDGGLIVRLMDAECEEDVLRAVGAMPEVVWEETPHRVHVGRGGLLLFDSAYPGDGLPSMCGDGANVPWLKTLLPPGTYKVDTADYEPEDSTRLILHRVRRS